MRIVLWVFCGLALDLAAAEAPADLEFFEKRIRPLLAEKCYECHSASAKKVKGGLFLDTREGWSKGGDSGPAIVPGEPDKSLFVRAIRWTDPDTQMPPKNKLAEAQISDLEQWVKLGAPDPRIAQAVHRDAELSAGPLSRTNHWAYQPLRRFAPPKVKDEAWPRTAVDRFILAKIEECAAKPAADAERAVLARRVYFDLTGLPPAPGDLQQFVNDASPGAFARLVDRLLASPQFGELWARHWFDLARFAESVTLRGFIFKEAWRYRDYVIGNFNRDVPFDQFVREQIAGDLLPGGSVEQRRRKLIATTFLALGNTNLEEQDKKQLDMDVVDEQLDTIGKALLGQTIGCARCHDHKFDPIPTRDYYAMAGILRNSRLLKHANVSEWLEVPLPVEPEQEKILEEHEAAIAALQSEIKSAKDAAKALAGRNGESKPGAGSASQPAVIPAKDLPGIVVDSAQAKAVGTWKHSQYSKRYIGDGYWHDDNSGKGEKTLTFMPELAKPGRYEVRLAYVHAPNRATNVPVTVFHADGETTVAVNEQEPPIVGGRFVSLGVFPFEANGFAHVLVANEGTRGHVIADAVQFLPAEDLMLADRGQPQSAPGSVGARQSGRDESGSAAADIKPLEDKLKKLQETGPKRPKSMSVVESETIEDLPVHIRGSVHNLGAKVPRGFLTVAMRQPAAPIPVNQSGRRELADWIVSADNPLTARVYVNRVWYWLLGEGLVRTVDNFGTTGEAPSHPELLDYLAARFVEEGWSTKCLIREIVLSRVYQLGPVTTDSLARSEGERAGVRGRSESALTSKLSSNFDSRTDPENRLFRHANRRRLSAEQLRDAMLAVSGELDLRAPNGPAFPLNRAADFGFVHAGNQRSVYLPVFRNALPDMFEAFDFAVPGAVVGKRSVSTVPTQALFLLNHPFVRERAEAAARRVLSEPTPDNADPLDRAYRLALGRPANSAERALVLRHVSQPEGDALQDWTGILHALFASADFRYLD